MKSSPKHDIVVSYTGAKATLWKIAWLTSSNFYELIVVVGSVNPLILGKSKSSIPLESLQSVAYTLMNTCDM